MTFEIVNYCMDRGLYIDDSPVYAYSDEELLEFAKKLLDKVADADLIEDALECMVSMLGEYQRDESPCEQCGTWQSNTTYILEEE